MSKSLSDMALEVHEVNAQNGWFESERSFGEGMALIHSEVSEALEAYREHGELDVTGEPTKDLFYSYEGDLVREDETPAKPEGIGSEFADILIRLLDEAFRWDIDLEAEYERKVAYNKTRGYRHGGKRL